MHIQAILFDAEGSFSDHLCIAVGPGNACTARDEMWTNSQQPALFDVERQALEGGSDFISAPSSLLVERHCQGTLQDALAAWTMIEPDLAMTRIVEMLRRNGFRCYLATNQEPHRASYMSGHLGYCRLLDQEFTSPATATKTSECDHEQTRGREYWRTKEISAPRRPSVRYTFNAASVRYTGTTWK
jgi:hypothetical protein